MALSADRKAPYAEGFEWPIPVGASKEIFAGSLVVVDGTTGYAEAGSDAAGKIFVGVAREHVKDVSGVEGTESVIVRRRGLFLFAIAAATQANVGDAVFIVDDETVGLAATTTNDIYCGVIAAIKSATEVWVDIYPALLQTDVATHIADTSGAHSASAISIADAGGFTEQDEAEAALQEIYQDLISAQHVIPAPIGAFVGEDGTALTKFTAGATPGFQQLADKEVVLAWDGNATPGAAAVVIPFVDPAIDDSADVVVHFLAKMAGATDTPVVAFEAYFGAGDADCAGTDPEITGGTTLTEYTMTIAAADVPAAPSSLTLVLTPTAGQMDTDELHLYALWLEVTRKLRTS